MAKPLQKIMRYIGEHGIVRSRDIEAIGIPRQYLVRLHHQGKLKRPGRGIYTLADAKVTERHSYAEVAKRVSFAAELPSPHVGNLCPSRTINAVPTISRKIEPR